MLSAHLEGEGSLALLLEPFQLLGLIEAVVVAVQQVEDLLQSTSQLFHQLVDLAYELSDVLDGLL